MSRTRQLAQPRHKHTPTMVALVAIFLLPGSFQLAAQGKWTRKADMPTARVGATANLVDNKIYVIGGYASGSAPNLPTTEAFNPQTNTWNTGLSPMPTSRSYVASAMLHGTIYVLGGGYPDATTVNEAYTPATNSWDTTAIDLPVPCRAMSAAVVDSTVYVVGGAYNVSECYAHTPTVPVSSWKSRTPIPVGAAYVSTTVYRGLVYAFGGGVGGSATNWVGISSVSAYNPKTNQWIPKKPMPTPRFGLLTYLVGDAIYAIGGSQAQGTALGTVEVYYPLEDRWEQRPSMPHTAVGHSGAVFNDTIYVIGGTSNWSDMLNQVWAYSPLTTEVGHSSTLPEGLLLEQNYPNPFNPSTVIRYHLPVTSEVRLVVCDLLGREVALLVNELKPPGSYEVSFNAAGLSSGIYVCRLTAGRYRESRQMLLIR